VLELRLDGRRPKRRGGARRGCTASFKTNDLSDLGVSKKATPDRRDHGLVGKSFKIRRMQHRTSKGAINNLGADFCEWTCRV
jgi:hypothetical protein